ncbi:YbjQ family protein [Kutzneria sp. CA-103260]|uniref:YbjQ family protein n=1 Tax=Kutzneria sp. CA-103260 TaxID=2802641 RepID=UPI001BA4CE1E|nr:heavy metal-binding domain-containing protein [Kutzneria sp. CA-103260]QUQ70475.1 Putative heavy-metal-binding protein [Kutzneria sp. CA-103260]
MSQPSAPPQFPILISTMNDVPGCRVTHVFGEVFGLTVRSRAIGVNFMAGLKSLGGGEVTQYTQMLTDSRNEAIGRLCQMAMGYGANAVLAMRFDCNEIAQTMSEVAAYGTAVFIVPNDQQAQQHAGQAHQPPAPQQQQQQYAPQQQQQQQQR